MEINSEFKTIPTSDGKMRIYCAYPKVSYPFPSLIVFQEAFGVNEHIQDVCQRFAREGYYVVSPELYHRSGESIHIDYTNRKGALPFMESLNEDKLAHDIEATLNYLKAQPFVIPRKIASLGFCMGGYTSILAACRFPLATSISFYGAGLLREREGIGFGPLRKEFKNISCPLLLFFGQKDSSIPMEEVSTLEEEFDFLGIPYQSVVFKNAQHGFFCDQRPSYHPQAALEAWKMTLQWLNEHLITPQVENYSQTPSELF